MSIFDFIVDVFNLPSHNPIIQALDDGIDQKIIIKSIRAALARLATYYRKDDYFDYDLIMAFKSIPKFWNEYNGIIIYSFMREPMVPGYSRSISIVDKALEAAGYKIIPQDENMTAKQLVDAVDKNKPDILVISATIPSHLVLYENTINLLKEAGLRDKVKVIVSDLNYLSKEYGQTIEVDSIFNDFYDAIMLADEFMGVSFAD